MECMHLVLGICGFIVGKSFHPKIGSFAEFMVKLAEFDLVTSI